MKRSLLLVLFALLTINLLSTQSFAQTPPPVTSVNLAPFSPQLTAVDPYANAASSSDGLKPARPFWYSVDNSGLTILRIGDNKVVYRIPWPATLDIALPEGDGPDFMNIPAPTSGWAPMGMAVTYPTEESLASTSETPATYVFVVMAHSGYEWASNSSPTGLRDPGVRDTLRPATSPDTESSMLVEIDVTDPTYPVATYPTGPSVVGAILGHGAGQPAFDPATGNVYIGNMPSRSLPTGPTDLTSFVSVIAPIAMAEVAAAAEPVTGPPDPPLVLCGPEHPDEGLLAGEPYVWPCVAEGGEGELVWEFTNLPSWLTSHHDKLSGELDGILYGTPLTDGLYTFQVRVTDLGDDPANPEPNSSDWTTVSLNVSPTGVAAEAEAGFEVGVAGGQGIAGTGNCTPGTSPSVLTIPGLILPPNWQPSPASMVPNWIDVQPALIDGVVKGCYVMGTAPISGEYYEFALPNFRFAYPFDREAVIFSGNVAGTYIFDPLPAGVTVSGLAWHQIEKIHDPSTEADILNGEFIGVEPFTGQLYRILLPQGAPEGSGGEANVTAPEISVELDEITPLGQPLLGPLQQLRPDIAAQSTQPHRAVALGDLAVEADRDIFVTARWILDPDNNAVILIGGPAGSPIENGALIRIGGTNISTVDLQGVQACSLALNSDLRPAIPGSEPGQKDNGALWVTGTTSGKVAVVDTALGTSAQTLDVTSATSLGGISVDTGTGVAYVAAPLLKNVTIFGNGYLPRAPEIWLGVEPTATFNIGVPGSFTVLATGTPTPNLSYVGTLPAGVTFVNNGDGTATFAGTAAVGTGGDYTVTVTASNGILPNSAEAFVLTVPLAPSITSANTATFTVGSAGSFTVTSIGAPGPVSLLSTGTLPNGVTFADNEDSTATLAGTPAAGTQGTYVFTIIASTGVPPDATQEFTLIVNPGSGGGTDAAPAITSVSTTTFTVGEPGSFQFMTTGSPTPNLSRTGALPSGVIFVDNRNGTAALAGTPLAGSQGSYPITITAANGILPNATQAFTLTVNPASQTAPTITSANATNFTVGSAGSFTVTVTGTPTPSLSHWGTLPNGVTFTDNGNGTATLAGTSTTAGSYLFTITAANGVMPNATQNFTLTVSGVAPAITSGPTATFTVGSAGSFTVMATGSPAPQLIAQGALPSGVTFVDNHNGTAALAGTPTTGTAGSYPLNITAANGVSPNATQRFTLTVNAPRTAPAITSASSSSFTVGSAGSFTVTTTGSLPMTLSETGMLPSGVTFADNGNGTAILGGTPATGTAGRYLFTITASNGVSPNATQTFTLTVIDQASSLTIVSPQILPAGTAGQQYSYQLQVQGGTPPYTWSLSGRLPSGLRLSSAGLISGRAGNNAAGNYTFTVQVTDSARQSNSKGVNLIINVRPPRQ